MPNPKKARKHAYNQLVECDREDQSQNDTQ
jgi:hypothetical protein